MGDRLHPAAIAVYALRAVRDALLPVAVIVGVAILGGRLDAGGLRTAVLYGVLGVAAAALHGVVRWASTTWRTSQNAIRVRRGWLSVEETEVPLARVQALDVHQGPVQRLFGVHAVHVQTAGGGKGGEIVLDALPASEVERLRGLVARHAAPAEPGLERKLPRRMVLLAAVTSGQIGVVVPVLAGVAQVVQQLVRDPVEGERTAVRLLPQDVGGWVLAIGALLVAAWVLAAAGSIVAFAGFRVRRTGRELQIRRGLLARRAATVPVERVRAVRVVEGVLRRPLRLATLRVEVIGYAKEESAAQTLFPLLRRRDVRGLLDELLPELAADLDGLAAPPPRALRRYLLPPAALALVAGAGAALLASSPWPLVLVAAGAGYGALRWRAAGWRLHDEHLAISQRRLARTTVLARAAGQESHALAQTVLQRRAGLADVEVALGRRTRARIRHLELAVASDLWAALR